MIKNEATWKLDEAPDSFKYLLDEIEEGENVGTELEPGTLYAQAFNNPETGFMQVHTGYYRPDWAEKYNLEETPFREELFFSCEPDLSEVNVYLRYTGEPIEVFDESDTYERKIVELSEENFEHLIENLKETGFLDWRNHAEDASATGSEYG